MAYRIDITYDPYTGQVQVCYDGRMEKFIETMLNPESILEKWPVKEFPATTINYRSYDDWEVVDNEFSQQWESEAAAVVLGTQTLPHVEPMDPVNEPIGEPIGVNSPVLSAHHASEYNSRASTPRSPVNRSPSRSPATPRSPKASMEDINMNEYASEYEHEHTANTTIDEIQVDPTHNADWMSGPCIPQTPQFFDIMKDLGEIQQLACKELAKELIKVWIPHKKSSYPYKLGDKQRPPQWPRGIPHEQPDHMSKDLRMCLIAYILLYLPKEERRQVYDVLQGKPVFEHTYRRYLLGQLCELD